MKKISLLLISVVLMVCMSLGAVFANDGLPDSDTIIKPIATNAKQYSPPQNQARARYTVLQAGFREV
jgi:hypothetical protein